MSRWNEKRVTFSKERLTIPIPNEAEWYEDYRSARQNSQFRNVLRFRRGIQLLNDQIGWIFDEEHRNRVYRKLNVSTDA